MRRESTDDEEMSVPGKRCPSFAPMLIDYLSYSQLPEMAHHFGSLQMI